MTRSLFLSLIFPALLPVSVLAGTVLFTDSRHLPGYLLLDVPVVLVAGHAESEKLSEHRGEDAEHGGVVDLPDHAAGGGEGH